MQSGSGYETYVAEDIVYFNSNTAHVIVNLFQVCEEIKGQEAFMDDLFVRLNARRKADVLMRSHKKKP